MIFFVAEALLKIACLKWNYFKDSYNLFDFCIVCTTIILQFLEFLTGEDHDYIIATRIFRLFRIFRLININKSLRMIFNTFIVTLPSIGNVGLLLLVIQLIFTILGVELFWMIEHQETLNENANYMSSI